ncbi:DgyrCDS11816 [Dimorphilus gyrociliatus]|uniref:DgyrCDS11816 n=1 Tax=Dimorphilus gyrociliatus TaxID=2664684 RepID=A0A7I8W5I1_9ANNE|nr:DgyrCDS11816 [Dimorphilus gyrociliatus]
MVFFTCNGCGEALKKNQVEKHRFKCRGSNVLSCVDCSKDFRGNEYQTHIKCISEEEKYSGKGFKPKPGLNKGEKKQQSWTERVQQAAAKEQDRQLSELLNKIADCANVPRKEKKFVNFLKNSWKIHKDFIIQAAWKAINESPVEETLEEPAPVEKQEVEDKEKKLSKREKKELRKEENHKIEKKDKSKTDKEECESLNEEEVEKKVKNKKKKRKNKKDKEEKSAELEQEEDSDEPKRKKISNEETEEEQSSVEKKKKKRKKNRKTEVEENGTNNLNGHSEEKEEEKSDKTKFNIEKMIVTILKKQKEKTLSQKLLRKKIIHEYETRMSKTMSEKLKLKLTKKLNDKSVFKISNDKVCLRK